MRKLILNNETKEEAIKHYDTMISYIKKQNLNSMPMFDKMEKDIGEAPYAEWCSYCKKYEGKEKCPLRCPILDSAQISNDPICKENNCMDLWYDLDDARTWADWLKCAYKVRTRILLRG